MVGQLRRRVTEELRLDAPDGPVTVCPGQHVEILLDHADADPRAVGDAPLPVRPGRTPEVDAGLSFGDGPHRCPGAHIALPETDVFLSRLFALDGLRMTGRPHVGLRGAIGGYETRGLTVALPRAGRD